MSAGKYRHSALAGFAGLFSLVFLLFACFIFGPGSLYLSLDPGAKHYSAPTGTLSVNVTGKRTRFVGKIEYRQGDTGPWLRLDLASPRLSRRSVVFELFPNEAKAHEITVNIRATSKIGTTRRFSRVVQIEAGSAVPVAPYLHEWIADDLETQDGRWELAVAPSGETGSWVRPSPGTEAYDRILLAGPSFSGPRRVEFSFVLDEIRKTPAPYGVGVLALWGGHLETTDRRPRRGWEYALGWWYSAYPGFGVEIARRVDNGPISTDNATRDEPIELGKVYHMALEARPISKKDARGIALRMKWSNSKDELESADWILETFDTGQDLSVNKSYAIGVLAHRTSARFSPIQITPLTD